MKTIKITLIALFTLIGVTGIAQKGKSAEQRQAKIDSILTKALELTDTEAKAFLPMYHEYKAEQRATRSKFKPKKEKKKMDELTDAELEEVIQKKMAFTQAQLDLKKKYHEKFKTALPMKKVAKFYHIEKRIGSKMRKNKGKGKRNGKSRRMGKPKTQIEEK